MWITSPIGELIDHSKMIRVVLFIRRHRYLVAVTLEENTANHLR
nr:MAG TPA: hypothetical protein [Caudoviricetes sp.]